MTAHPHPSRRRESVHRGALLCTGSPNATAHLYTSLISFIRLRAFRWAEAAVFGTLDCESALTQGAPECTTVHGGVGG